MQSNQLDGTKFRLSQPESLNNKVYLNENKKNLKLQGWLKKKSPAILKGWQKRFFMLIENEGYKLVYFDDDKTNSKPKGAFEISNKIDIEQAGEEEFTIIFPGRNLELKAKSGDERKKWVETIEFCKSIGKNSQRKYLSVDLIENDISKSKGSTHKKVDLQTTQIVQIEKEKIENQKFQGHRDIQKKSIILPSQFEDSQILEVLGLQQLNQNSMLKSRTIFGTLSKRSKTKMKNYKLKWFILISAKPLFPEIQDDEEILQQQDITLELDTLVYINQKMNDKLIKRNVYIKLQNCKEIIIKNMQKSSDHGFIFKLNMGDKIYSLMANTENDRMKWQQALNQSMNTCKEINNKLNLNILKNINPVIRIYDMESSLPIRRQKIKEKLQNDIQRIELEQSINDQNRYLNLQDLLCCLMIISQDMIKSIEACLVKDPQRQDIIQEYIEIHHEKICLNISEYWNINNKYLSLNEIKELASWLSDYQQIIINYIKDDRIKQGINTLLQIYINRWKIQSEKKIIAQFEQSQTIQAKNTTKTACVLELFDIVQEIEMLITQKLKPYLKNKELLKVIKSILWHYLEQLYDSVEEQPENLEFLIGVCNDVEIVREIANRIESIAEMLQENKKQEKTKQKIMQKYNEVLEIVEQQIYNISSNELTQQFQVSLLDLEIRSGVLEVFEENVQLIKLTEQTQQSLLDKLISTFNYHYFNIFLNELDKINSYKRKQIESKIKQDKQVVSEFLKQYHCSNIKMDNFDLMIQLLNCEKDSEYVQAFRGLKYQFGRCFTVNTVKVIIGHLRVRKSEVNQSSLEQFDQLIRSIDDEQDNGESTQDLKSQLMEFGQNQLEPLVLQKQDSNSSRTSRTSMSKSKVNIEELISKSQAQSVQFDNTSITEGYVYKKKAKQQKLVTKWDHRYVRIRKGYIYWYVDEKSWKCQNKLNVQDILEVEGKQNKQNKFILKMRGGKIYEFKVDTVEERNMWMNGITNEKRQQEDVVNSKIEAQQVQTSQLNILIKNYDEEIITNKTTNNNINNNNKFNNQQRKTTLIIQQKEYPLELGQTTLKIKRTTSCWTSFMVCLGLSKG
ncbi:unnamed protein product (macronuclear) [Paramecium tetraurelia]|uniref:PH domain-containing protein n=1 Tax=Paramecium tetraurelia TaxID=5888 RepID=A0E6T7_PARTE|nr:uncharacterized protein GSPATT00023732001 [Paramecium tetraurelia]CAK91004.1 unnamed protein product [Paramecium tetraurelia]|eukprot:XP_001458401.1 hypothetical protein (macronuclear) [Paramecium tetraurelia strain d4-2]